MGSQTRKETQMKKNLSVEVGWNLVRLICVCVYLLIFIFSLFRKKPKPCWTT